jgi:hypothetical protein
MMIHGSALLSAFAVGMMGAMVAWQLLVPLILGLLDRGR